MYVLGPFFFLFKPATSKVYGFDSHVVLLVLCNMPFSGGGGGETMHIVYDC